MTSLFLYQIDYNLKVNVKYGVQTLYLKDQIFCLQFSFRFVLERLVVSYPKIRPPSDPYNIALIL